MAHEDERPILVCRVECPAAFQESLDEWMPKHFDDSLANPAVTSAHNYGVFRDWERLPSLFNDDGTRFIVYVADTTEGLVDWVDGPELREAIDDGVDREAQYPPLDDEPFNGSIYELAEIRRPRGADIAGELVDGAVERLVVSSGGYWASRSTPSSIASRSSGPSTQSTRPSGLRPCARTHTASCCGAPAGARMPTTSRSKVTPRAPPPSSTPSASSDARVSRPRRPARAACRPRSTASSPRSWAPTFSIGCLAASSRMRSKFGRPFSFSAIHSLANSPLWISPRIFFISALVCGVTTRGPRDISPYSAVSLIE